MTYEKGGLRQFADLKGGGVFEGVDTPMHTMLYNYYLNIDISKEQKIFLCEDLMLANLPNYSGHNQTNSLASNAFILLILQATRRTSYSNT